MAEIAAAKRKETEEAIEAAKAKGVPSDSEVEQRKARLRAQRDALRKAQEEKRQKELEDFNGKTETKSDLFQELKRMDANLKQETAKKAEEDKRKLEMYRKVRADMEQDNKAEKEAAY